MTLFAGEGANLAIWDAMLLGQSLVDALKAGLDKNRVWKAMRAFEEEMFTRAKEKAQETWDNRQRFIQPGTAVTVVEMFETTTAWTPIAADSRLMEDTVYRMYQVCTLLDTRGFSVCPFQYAKTQNHLTCILYLPTQAPLGLKILDGCE